MANREPLVIIEGKIKRLPSGDALISIPETEIFSYTGSDLTSIVSRSGTKTLVYSRGLLSTISDTSSNTLSTYIYTGDRLDSIIVTPL